MWTYAKLFWKRNQRTVTLQNMKMYYKVALIKTGWQHAGTDTQTDGVEDKGQK